MQLEMRNVRQRGRRGNRSRSNNLSIAPTVTTTTTTTTATAASAAAAATTTRGQHHRPNVNKFRAQRKTVLNGHPVSNVDGYRITNQWLVWRSCKMQLRRNYSTNVRPNWLQSQFKSTALNRSWPLHSSLIIQKCFWNRFKRLVVL